MKPVIQQEQTGCAIASVAAIAGISYEAAKKLANNMGIYADDPALWSESRYIRRLLAKLGIKTANKEVDFTSWAALPSCALLSIKWHLENDQPHWHWAVFIREGELEYVIDSKASLKSNVRIDFGRMKPKWYIEVST